MTRRDLIGGLMAATVNPVLFAQEDKPLSRVRFIKSWHYDIENDLFSWTVVLAEVRGTEEVPVKLIEYEISLEEHIMSVRNRPGGDEAQKFTEEEAVKVGRVFKAITGYCQESVEWFERKMGVPVDGRQKPLKA